MELDRRPWPGLSAALDAALAAALAVVGLVSLWSTSPLQPADPRAPDALGVLLVLVGAASVAVRRVVPVTALAVALLSSVLVLHLGYSQVGGGLSVLLVLYTVAVQRPARVSAPLTLLTVLAVTVAVLLGPVERTLADWVANAVVFVTGWALGRSVRWRRARIAGLEEAGRALTAASKAETRAAVAEERAVIAREMQDLVAHSLAEVNVQVSAAKRLIARDPATAEQILTSAERSGRRTLHEMRRIVDLLAPGAVTDSRQPLPGLDDLPALVAQERSAGHSISLDVCGPVRDVPPGVALTSFRLVQERVAAVRRLHPDSAVRVLIDFENETLSVQVRDDGGGRGAQPGAGSGDGIAMRLLQRRAELYGGCLRTDENSVTATFPMDEPKGER